MSFMKFFYTEIFQIYGIKSQNKESTYMDEQEMILSSTQYVEVLKVLMANVMASN